MRQLTAALLALFATTLAPGHVTAQGRPPLRNLGDLDPQGQGRNIAWYRRSLKPLQPLVGASMSRIFASGALGSQSSEVGLNLSPAAVAFATTSRSSTARGQNELCEVEGIQMNYLKQSTFNLHRYEPSSTVFPGSFVDARTILQRSPAFVGATNRAPVSVRISISNPRTGAPDSVSLADFSSNNIGQLNGMLRDRHFGAAFPALIVAQTDEIRSTEEMRAHLDATYGVTVPLEEFGLPLDVGAGVSASGDAAIGRARHTYMMTLVQPMYSYGVTLVDKSRLFTTPGATGSHANTLMVASVVFGRRVTILIESDSSIASVEAAVRPQVGLTFTGDEGLFQFGARANASLSTSFTRVVKRFRAAFYGGNAARANNVVSDPGQVAQFLSDPSAATLSRNTGEMPLDYTLEPVGTDGTVGVRSRGAFEALSCEEPVYRVEVRYKGLRVYKVAEGLNDTKEDLFGRIIVNGSTLKDIPESAKQEIAAGGMNDDDVRVVISESMTLGQLRAMRLQFGQSLKDWELLIKPEYRPLEPLEMQYDVAGVRTRITRALDATRDGRPVRLDTQEQVIQLYENANSDGSKIGIRYEVYVTRR
jgi:hypothetical protein